MSTTTASRSPIRRKFDYAKFIVWSVILAYCALFWYGVATSIMRELR